MAVWKVAGKKCDFKGIGDELGIDQVVVRIMRNRDMVDIEEMREFINASLKDQNSYENLKGIDEAVDVLMEKIEEGLPIRIIGDYDVDGIMSTYILYKGILECGGAVDTVIPHRIKDGYGINDSLIDDALNDGIDTIITCDNGIAAKETFDYAMENGLTCVVTDHHEIPYEEADGIRKYIIPNVNAVVDPKQEDCNYPFKGICGAVVALRVMECLFDAIGMERDILEELTELAGIATVCDVMELRGENRALVKNTIKCLSNSHNLGMRALVKVCGLEGKEISCHSIGFVIGPCINATGRLDSATLGLDLLKSTDYDEAIVLATKLKNLNESRKKLTEDGVNAAIDYISIANLEKDKVMVVYLPELHESLAGIVAGRIKERTGKPTFVVTKGEEGLKGSARSIEKYHIYDAMTQIKDVFTKYGGHAMAAGFSLDENKLEEFRTRINAECTLTPEDYEEKILIDVPMPMGYVTEGLIEQLSILEPFGVGNPKPIFAQARVEFFGLRLLGVNSNVARFDVATEDGKRHTMMLFRGIEKFQIAVEEKYGAGMYDELLNGKAKGLLMDVIYYPAINEYMGRRSIQFYLQDYK